MALTEFRAIQTITLLGRQVGEDHTIPTQEHRLRKMESDALQEILPYAQQAYFGALLYRFNLPLVDALGHIVPVQSRKDAEIFLEVVRSQHQSLHPQFEKPRRMGVIALGVLRTSRDTDERSRALQILEEKDHAAYELYVQAPELYSGVMPDTEVQEIRRLLQSDQSGKIQLALEGIPAFHAQVWTGI